MGPMVWYGMVLLLLAIGRKLNVHIAILALVRCSVGKIAAVSLRSGGCGEGHDWGLNGRVHKGRIIQTANRCFAVVCKTKKQYRIQIL